MAKIEYTTLSNGYFPVEKAESWRGAIFEVSEQGIDNIKTPNSKNYDYACCMVTQMRVDTQVIHGYSNTVSSLDVIFGNTVNKNVPITLTLEFPTVIDSNIFMDMLFDKAMASVSVLKGYRVDIMFANHLLAFALISQASVNYYPGTQGAVAQITVVGYDYHNNITKFNDTREWTYMRTILENLDDDYFGSGYLTSEYYDINLTSQINLSALALNFQENINIMGQSTEYTIYPRYPITLSATILVPLYPNTQNNTRRMNDDLSNKQAVTDGQAVGDLINPITETDPGAKNSIDMVFEQLSEHVANRLVLKLSSLAYGEFAIMPTAITTNREQLYQGVIGLSGIVIRHGATSTFSSRGMNEKWAVEGDPNA